MFFEQTFQSQISRENSPRADGKNNTFPQVVIKKCLDYLKLFLETSSIHGLNHLVANRRHPIEILLWLSLVVSSVFGALFLSQTTWSRYQYSPTVVSMDRDMYAWNTTFPCVTVCPTTKLDEGKLDLYVANSPEENKTLLKNFLLDLANATYINFGNITEYDGIPPEKYMDTIIELATVFKPSVTIGVTGIVFQIQPTITEMGLCYAINSEVAAYNSPSYRAENRWDVIKSENKSLHIHPLDGEVFAQLMNLTTGYNAYIHGPLEFPDISTKYQHSDSGFYLKLYISALTVYTSPEAARLSVPQRACRFIQENNLQHNSVYTYTMCRMECRIRLTLRYCNCIPHFYRNIGNEKICDVNGLKCLSNYQDELYKLQHKSGTKIDCGCLPLCDDVNYVIQSNILEKWVLGTNFQWGMVSYPRMRYRREIIFGFTDVLVSVGGMAGLFLGCSVLSFMEIVYFLSLRLLCYARSHNK